MNRRIVDQISKSKSMFFEKINKKDKPLAKLIKEKEESANIQNKLWGKWLMIQKEFLKIIRDYFASLYMNKFENLEETENSLSKYSFPN